MISFSIFKSNPEISGPDVSVSRAFWIRNSLEIEDIGHEFIITVVDRVPKSKNDQMRGKWSILPKNVAHACAYMGNNDYLCVTMLNVPC